MPVPAFALAALLAACSPGPLPAPMAGPAAPTDTAPPPATVKDMGTVLAESTSTDWRPLDPDNTVYLELPGGRVVIELAPAFAPNHVANIKALIREQYFDGLAVLRAQDNYVVQWGDPDGTRELKGAARTLPAEFTVPATGVSFTPIASVDGYAPEVGFADGFPAGRDPAAGQVWLAHCYGMVGVGRDTAPDSGGGTELYAVIGHAPRHLDRNITVVGRIVRGVEVLSTLPRGTGGLGFYEQPAERTPLRRVRIAADLPAAEQLPLEVLRTDTPTFAALVDSRRHRQDEWFQYPVGHVEVCNVPVPVRDVPRP